MKIAPIIAAVAAWEAYWWARRRALRVETHDRALATARALGRPLVVVGAPDLGATASQSGDIVIDIRPSADPRSIVADVCEPLPFDDNSCVVYVSCVFEYVEDFGAALSELDRISGGLLYVVSVEPWTVTSAVYPGAKRIIGRYDVPTLESLP